MMAVRTYAFEPPRWRPVSQMLRYTAGATFAGMLWAGLYAWLGLRLWSEGASLRDPLNLALAAGLALAAALILLVWWELARRWLRHLHPSARRALNQTQLLALTPAQFEEYVARRIFERQGYHVTNTPDTRDGGVDIQLTDLQGRIAIVQCKRYRGAVGEVIVRDLYGTMLHTGADHAFLVTTGSITQDARRWAAGKPIDLIDGRRLAELARSVPGGQPPTS